MVPYIPECLHHWSPMFYGYRYEENGTCLLTPSLQSPSYDAWPDPRRGNFLSTRRIYRVMQRRKQYPRCRHRIMTPRLRWATLCLTNRSPVRSVLVSPFVHLPTLSLSIYIYFPPLSLSAVTSFMSTRQSLNLINDVRNNTSRRVIFSSSRAANSAGWSG